MASNSKSFADALPAAAPLDRIQRHGSVVGKAPASPSVVAAASTDGSACSCGRVVVADDSGQVANLGRLGGRPRDRPPHLDPAIANYGGGHVRRVATGVLQDQLR